MAHADPADWIASSGGMNSISEPSPNAMFIRHKDLRSFRKLADGLHPETGQVVGGESLYQHPQAVRALNRAVQALEFQKQRERSRKSLPANAGKPWSNEEDARICEELRHGTNSQEIARIHNRTAGSIVARLIRLSRISANTNRPNSQLPKSA